MYKFSHLFHRIGDANSFMQLDKKKTRHTHAQKITNKKSGRLSAKRELRKSNHKKSRPKWFFLSTKKNTGVDAYGVYGVLFALFTQKIVPFN